MPKAMTPGGFGNARKRALHLPKPNVLRKLLSTAFAGMNLRKRLRSVALPPAGWRMRYGPLMAARIFAATACGDGAVVQRRWREGYG